MTSVTRTRILIAAAFGVGLLVGPRASIAQEAPESRAPAVVELRLDFNQAMRKSLADRVPALEVVERRLEAASRGAHGHAVERLKILELLHRTQIHLAKFPESRETFGRFAQALRGWDERERARVALLERVRQVRLHGHPSEAYEVAAAARPAWSDDSRVSSSLIMEQALSLEKLVGRVDESLPLLEEIIAEDLDSAVRPHALRQLAHLQANGYGGGPKAAIGTLKILQEQYRGTWWEQYAHMKPAVILEVRLGEPQKALERYQETLTTYPDHKFATFCRAQVVRLQNIVEEQLIRDALEGLGQNEGVPEAAPTAQDVEAAVDREIDAAGPVSMGLQHRSVTN